DRFHARASNASRGTNPTFGKSAGEHRIGANTRSFRDLDQGVFIQLLDQAPTFGIIAAAIKDSGPHPHALKAVAHASHIAFARRSEAPVDNVGCQCDSKEAPDVVTKCLA